VAEKFEVDKEAMDKATQAFADAIGEMMLDTDTIGKPLATKANFGRAEAFGAHHDKLKVGLEDFAKWLKNMQAGIESYSSKVYSGAKTYHNVDVNNMRGVDGIADGIGDV
jgi:hypothetical protein